MFSFLIQSKIFSPSRYEWFTYVGRTPVEVSFRNKPIMIEKGMRFGVRKSVNGKDIRLIFDNDPNRVITLSLDQAQALAKGVK